MTYISNNECAVKKGMRIGKYFWGLWGPKVQEVGTMVRAGGGYIVPVKYTSGKCALLRVWDTVETTSLSLVLIAEVQIRNANCAALLRNSIELPKVIRGQDPGILYLHVVDSDEIDDGTPIHNVYELQIMNLLGHIGAEDRVIPLHDWL